MSLTFLSAFAPAQKTQMTDVMLQCAMLALKPCEEGGCTNGYQCSNLNLLLGLEFNFFEIQSSQILNSVPTEVLLDV